MFPSVMQNTVMENPQDFFSKLENSDDPLMGDDDFNDSGADFFDKLLAEEAKNSSGSSSGHGSGLNTQSLLEDALYQSNGSLTLDVKDMEDDILMDGDFDKGPGLSSKLVDSSVFPGLGNVLDNKQQDSSSDWNGDLSSNKPLNTTLDAVPINVSLGEEGGIASVLRKKTPSSQAFPKFGIVTKTNKTAAKLRSNKSDGLLARALKQKYNSSSSLYNVNRNGNDTVVTAGKIPRNALSAIGTRNNDDSDPNGNLTGVEQVEGSKNASWATSDLLRQAKLGTKSSSRSSMQDMLRLCKKQSKSVSALRQSSAQSLLMRTSGLGSTKPMDVSSLLPPQHASVNRAFGNGTIQNFSFQTNNFLSTMPAEATETASLLHQSCRLYPTTTAVVQSALRIDPDAVRNPITPPLEKGKSKKVQNTYGYPINVALSHGGSLEVLKMLADAAPEVLLKKDGSDGSGSLSVALTAKCDQSVIIMLLRSNRECIKVADRRGNYPLHVAANYGASFGIVRKLYKLYPAALQMKNFHSETPLDIAQRSTRCSEEVMNFLQTAAFSSLESAANRMEALDLEDGLDDIMEANL